MRVHAVGLASGADRAANLAASVAAVHAAVDDGADLVVLPEYAAGFEPGGVGPEHAEPLDGPYVAALVDAVAGTGTVVLAGTVLAGSTPERGVNVVVALDAGGVLGTYRKVHLYDAFGHRESDRLEAGDPGAPPLVLDVAGLRVGVITCYDLRFPESARRLVDAGAQVIAVPAAWAAGEHKADHWLALLRARAIESTAYVVGVAMQGRGLAGVPTVVDPLGVVLGHGASVVADLDPAVVVAVRERNPSLLNRRYAVVERGQAAL